MDHNDIRHKLSEFIDDAVTPGEKAAIEQHLKTCTGCADALRELRKTIEHIHAIEEVESPVWMTQKILAKVRGEQEAKQRPGHRFFAPFFAKFPVRAVAVIFLAVTAYYMYASIEPARKYIDAPVETTAKKEIPAVGLMREEGKKAREAAPEAAQAPGKPGYRSLDMKYSYESPAAPVPQQEPAVSAPSPAPPRRADRTVTAHEADSTDRQSLSPKTAAPMMADQTAPAAGADRLREAGHMAAQEKRRDRNALSPDQAAEDVLAVNEHFARYELSPAMKVKGLRFSARKIDDALPDLLWLRNTRSFQADACMRRYVVDVELSGTLSKYLYCYDHSRVRLIGIYELRQGAWSEKQH